MTQVARMRDLRDFIEALEKRGKLYRFNEPINKDSELYPVFRVQQRGLREGERKALLFTNVVDAKGKHYDMDVLAGAYAADDETLFIGLGIENHIEGLERWHHARTNPLEPVIVDSGPVQENVIMGDELKKTGLNILPVPVEEPGFSGMLRCGLPMISKDPVTGVRNVGTYNAFLKAPDRMQAAIGPGAHAMAYHWKTARERGEGLPIAIVIGCDVPTMAVSSASIPYGVDELGVAGAFAGQAMELVRCKTIPLEVPAHAECVIEGVMSSTVVEPRLPFGEYPGYIHSDLTVRPIFQVTAITYRNNAIFTPVLVGMPPSDTSVVWGFVHAGEVYHRLKYDCGLPIEEIYYPDWGGGSAVCLIRVTEDATPEQVNQLMAELEKKGGDARKYTIIVDSDIDLRDAECVWWALAFRTSRRRDIILPATHGGGLDPSGSAAGTGVGKLSAEGAEPDFTRIVINATRKWNYPPVALPKRQFMERAMEIWAQHDDLKQPSMRQPWYGYTLGHWNEELQRYADMIVAGDYVKLGEEMVEYQQPLRDDMVGRNVDRSLE